MDVRQVQCLGRFLTSNDRRLLFLSTAFTVTLAVSGETGGCYPAGTLPAPGERAWCRM